MFREETGPRHCSSPAPPRACIAQRLPAPRPWQPRCLSPAVVVGCGGARRWRATHRGNPVRSGLTEDAVAASRWKGEGRADFLLRRSRGSRGGRGISSFGGVAVAWRSLGVRGISSVSGALFGSGWQHPRDLLWRSRGSQGRRDEDVRNETSGGGDGRK